MWQKLRSLLGRKALLGASWLEILGVAVAAGLAYYFFSPAAVPTLAEYVAATEGRAKVISSGTIDLAGVAANCNNFPLVLDDRFDDHGGAWPQSGFIILNPKYLFGLPKIQQLFTFYHECGHMMGQKPELDADCYAIGDGVSKGWLDGDGLDQLCAYWRPKKGDAVHPPGTIRCENMVRCFNQARASQPE